SHERLDHEPGPQPGGDRPGEGPGAHHQEVESPGDELRDDQGEAGHRPDEPSFKVHRVLRFAARALGVSSYSAARRAEITFVLTPAQPRPPKNLPCSIFMQRFSTTWSPAASARARASRFSTPSCIQSTFAPIAIASSASAGISEAFRKQSTTSTFSGMSARRL